MNISELVQKIYGIFPEKNLGQVEAVVEVGVGAMPLVSSALNFYKFKKINQKLGELAGEITTIAKKLETSENEIFFKQEVFPIVLNCIMNDEQVDKIKIVLNGFEYIIDNEILDLDKIFHFYDVLSEMRISEIVHLTKKYIEPMEWEKNPIKLKLKPLKLKMEYTDEDNEKEDLERYMDNKLFRLGILEYVKERVNESFQMDYIQDPTPYQWTSPPKDKYEIDTDRYRISRFGVRFIKFFYEEE